MHLSGISVSLRPFVSRKPGRREISSRFPISRSKKRTWISQRKRSESEPFHRKGELLVRRSRDGDVNLLKLTPPEPAPKAAQKSEGPEKNPSSLQNPGLSP